MCRRMARRRKKFGRGANDGVFLSNPVTSSREMTVSMLTCGQRGEKEDAGGIRLSNRTVVA